MQATLKRVKDELRQRMHQPIPEQGQWLAQVIMGFFAYHAVPTNRQTLGAFRHARRGPLAAHAVAAQSERTHPDWARMLRLANAWLPPPRILTPGPRQRFDVKHPRREPSA